jgi:hypothetical protein
MDTGYGAMIPCKGVSQGTMKYYVQGFNDNNDPVATSGSRNKPFTVPVRPQITGDPPSLPDQEPPKQCTGGADNECPPDFPGCGGSKKSGGEECEKNSECKSGTCTEGKCLEKKSGGEECESDSECTSGTCSAGKCTGKKAEGEACETDDECDSSKCKEDRCAPPAGVGKLSRIWLGLSLQLDLSFLPGADNVCMLDPKTATPVAAYSCIDPGSGANFPGTGRISPGGPTINSQIQSGRSDQVQGGVKPGNFRILASLDYALSKNALLGLRGGYVLLTDPATGTPGAAFAPIHIEARFTYVVGKDALVKKGMAPMVFVGLGAGEFDAFVPVTVFKVGDGPTAKGFGFNAWITAGPVFMSAGGGARFGLSHRAAVTAALKLEAAFGGSAGFLPGVAPELGVQFGL